MNSAGLDGGVRQSFGMRLRRRLTGLARQDLVDSFPAGLCYTTTDSCPREKDSGSCTDELREFPTAMLASVIMMTRTTSLGVGSCRKRTVVHYSLTQVTSARSC